MTFIDTNIFVAALNERDEDHRKCKILLEKALEKREWLYTSDYILDECFSVAWSRTRKLPRTFRLSLIRRLDDAVQGSERVKILKVDERDFSTAKSFLREHPEVISTLTDWTSLVLMRREGISEILSLDEDFDRARRIQEFSRIVRIADASQISAGK